MPRGLVVARGAFFMARLRHSSKPATIHSRRGTPTKLENPLRDREEPPSLMTYYQRQGKLKQHTQAQMLKARHLYVTKAQSSDKVAAEVGVPIPIIEQWVVCFDWQERRDKLLFQSFRKVHTLAKDRSKHIDARHDRIAGTIETLVEQSLHRHLDPDDEFELSPRDISTMAKSLKELQGIRRIVHDKPTSKIDVNKTITLDTDGSFENMRSMVEGFLGDKPQLSAPRNHQLEVSFPGGVQDAELEEVLEAERTQTDQ